ncbi:MAG: hypothetical protein ACFFBD_15335, partial [Candidatus Hodarchaeota archaeon]
MEENSITIVRDFLVQGVKTFTSNRYMCIALAIVFTITTGLLYLAFQTIESSARWLMVPTGILAASIAVYFGFHAFEWLRKYTGMILALIVGMFIFFLFLGDELFPNPLGEFNDLLLQSTLATFQTDLTSVVSIVVLQYFYILGILLGIITVGIVFFKSKSFLSGNPNSDWFQIFRLMREQEIKWWYQFLLIIALGIGILLIVSLTILIIFTNQTGFSFSLNLGEQFLLRLQFYPIL